MKAYSQDLRDRVIATYIENKLTRTQIARLYKINIDTVCDWVKRFLTTGDYTSKQSSNPGRSQTYTDKTSILDYFAQNPDANAIEARNALAPNVPISTFYDTLNRMEITYKKKNLSTKSVKIQ